LALQNGPHHFNRIHHLLLTDVCAGDEAFRWTQDGACFGLDDLPGRQVHSTAPGGVGKTDPLHYAGTAAVRRPSGHGSAHDQIS
jgi:hypothetical protein